MMETLENGEKISLFSLNPEMPVRNTEKPYGDMLTKWEKSCFNMLRETATGYTWDCTSKIEKTELILTPCFKSAISFEESSSVRKSEKTLLQLLFVPMLMES